jgi:hypothetical protein
MRAMFLPLLALGAALVGGRSLADAPARVTVEVAVDLEGTVWSGVDSDGDRYTFRYLPRGVLNYTSPSGTWKAIWRQHGTAVYMAMNDRYSEYWGRLDGDTIFGRAGNIHGRKWTWRVKQVSGAAR